ncbi:MAG: glycosyltransferase family 4 protein [Pontixanthobacter sp.]
MMVPAAPVPTILHLHSTFAAGGKELRSVQLINAFGQSADHAIVSADPARMEAARLISQDVTVAYITNFPSLRGRPGLRRLAAIARAMADYDLVCTYNWGAMDAVMAHRIFATRYGLPPLIHHEDGFNEDEFLKLKRRRNWYRRIALKTAHRLIVPSRTLAAVARDVWRQPDERLARIGNGIAVDAFMQPPQPGILPLPAKREGEYWVGTLAGLRKVKNLPRLVRAFACLPANWKLVILGEGPEEEAIRYAAERAGVSDRVHLPGFHADPARYVGAFDIFALSSDTEQFPICVAEAMAAGLPIVSPAVGDVPDMVGDTNVPFIVPRGVDDALSAALSHLAIDGELRAIIGRDNRHKAAAEFGEAQMTAQYRRQYWGAMEAADASSRVHGMGGSPGT